MHNVVRPNLVAMATKFWLGAEIQSPTGLSVNKVLFKRRIIRTKVAPRARQNTKLFSTPLTDQLSTYVQTRTASARSANSSNRQSELQWSAIDRRAKEANWAKYGALSGDGDHGGWSAGNAWQETGTGYRERRRTTALDGVGTRYADRAAQNIEYHMARAGEQLTRNGTRPGPAEIRRAAIAVKI